MNLIDKDELLHAVTIAGGRNCGNEFRDYILKMMTANLIDTIQSQPVITDEEKHAAWVLVREEGYITTAKGNHIKIPKKFMCTHCKKFEEKRKTKFCPHCGFRMDKKENEKMRVETKERKKRKELNYLKTAVVFKQCGLDSIYMTLEDDHESVLRPCVNLETGEIKQICKTALVDIIDGKFVEE